MIPQDTVNQILDTAQIADIVGDFVTLKRRGANLVACCPFHNEKTPSFYVSPAKGIYKCFGCGKSGTAVGFVMEHEHCTYVEALRYLARRYNIEVVEKEESAEDIAQRQHTESLYLVSDFAQKFYTAQLESGEGRSIGHAYFRSRAIEDGTIRLFGLGWAPSGRTALMDAALKEGYKLEYLIDAGLCVKREDGSVVDKFRERAMFPVHSVSGRVVAFSGRTLKADNPAKYVNTAETEIYVKSRNLLGIYFAKAEISRLKKCILVEGNVDMVMMHQLGIRNVVASCGTSLTIEQIKLIKRFADDVTIMYDGDSAGIHAALRGINLVLAEGLNVKIVLLPDGDDPDSFCRKHTLAEVRGFIDTHERDFIEFKTELLLGEAAGDPLKKANLINDIADTIAGIPDPVKRSVYVDATASRFGIESSLLYSRINSERASAHKEQPSGEQASQAPEQRFPEPENKTLEPSEKDLVRFILTNGCDPLVFETDSAFYVEDEQAPTVADFIRSSLEADGSSFANSLCRRVYDEYMHYYDDGLEQQEILRRIFNSSDRDAAGFAVSLSEHEYMLTVASFENALTTTSSWLVTQVPKAIMVYAERRLQDRIDKLRKVIGSTEGEEQIAAMTEMMKLQNAKRKVNQKIGREKI